MFGTPREERDAFDRHQTRGAVSLFVETKWNFRRKQHTLSFGKPPTQHRAFARVLPSRQSYVDQTKRVLFVDVWCASLICGNHMCFLLVCMYVCVCATKIPIQLSSVCVRTRRGQRYVSVDGNFRARQTISINRARSANAPGKRHDPRRNDLIACTNISCGQSSLNEHYIYCPLTIYVETLGLNIIVAINPVAIYISILIKF